MILNKFAVYIFAITVLLSINSLAEKQCIGHGPGQGFNPTCTSKIFGCDESNIEIGKKWYIAETGEFVIEPTTYGFGGTSIVLRLYDSVEVVGGRCSLGESTPSYVLVTVWSPGEDYKRMEDFYLSDDVVTVQPYFKLTVEQWNQLKKQRLRETPVSINTGG